MKRYDLIVVGAGPSGLSAAIEAAKRGLKVVVFDEMPLLLQPVRQKIWSPSMAGLFRVSSVPEQHRP